MSRIALVLALVAALAACRDDSPSEPDNERKTPPGPTCTEDTSVRLDAAKNQWVVGLLRCVRRSEPYVDEEGYVRVRTVFDPVTMTCFVPNTVTQDQAVSICEDMFRAIHGY